MTAIDPFSYPAENDISLAASRLELASGQLDEVGDRQHGRRSDETLLRFAELNIQRAQAGAMLAIAHQLDELTAELRQVAPAVDGAKGALEEGLGDIAGHLWKAPRWWTRLWWKLRGFNDKPDIEAELFATARFRLDLKSLTSSNDEPIATTYIHATTADEALELSDHALHVLAKDSGIDPDNEELYGDLSFIGETNRT